MIPTLAEARAEVFAVLDVGPEGVEAVYDHEPTGETTGAVWVTVTFSALRSTSIVVAVRIYAQTADSPATAAEQMEVAVVAVDDLLKAAGHFPSDWDSGLNDELQCLVARCFVEVPRETF